MGSGQEYLRLAAATWFVCFAYMAHAAGVDPLNIPDTQLEPVNWADLAGWKADDHAVAFATFLASCKPFLAIERRRDPRPIADGLLHACRRAAATKKPSAVEARKFFEENFRPVRIARLGKSTGLLTGYYEPIVEGSRFPNPEFHWPLYRRPRDLLVNGKKPARVGFPNRAAVGRLNAKGQVEPYYDRRAIEDGALDGQHLEICWLKDPFEAMSIEIQGSARVRLEDGTLLRLNYDAHNGFARTAVGPVPVQPSMNTREKTSMDRMKRWMAAHPEEAKEARAANRSYVFFRVTGLNNEDEPTGAQGVPLHPGRSIAVDHAHVFGTPFFIEADVPIGTGRANAKFRRLMIAKDTGSAIVGPARADVYWGAGDDAGRIAGRIWQQGRFVILLPRELDMVAAGKTMPLPQPKPPISHEMVASRGDGNQAQGYRTDRAKPQPETVGNAQNVDKKSLSNVRKQSQPASNDTTRPRARAALAHGNGGWAYRNDRAKPQAEKTQAEKTPIGNLPKTENHKKSHNVRQQAHPASKDGTNPRF